jgi:hypothetical protein
MRPLRLAAIPLIVLLSGCPSLFGSTGNNDLSPRLLAVTENKGAGAVANSYLEWQPVTNATRYQVTRTLNTVSEALPKSDKLSFSEAVGIGSAITYKVVALDASDNEKATSSALTVNVLPSEIAPPDGIQIDGKPTSSGNITSVSTGKPNIVWAAVDKATHYYVRVYNNSDDKTLFAAFTKDPQATVGTLVWNDIKVPNYPQVKDQSLPSEKVVNVTVAAIRANDADLKVATAFDIKTSAVSKAYRE